MAILSQKSHHVLNRSEWVQYINTPVQVVQKWLK